MRRQRKHRHHPDIWRERHVEEKIGRRHWIGAQMQRPSYAVFTAVDFLAAIQRVWDDVPLVSGAPYVKGHIMGGIPEFETHSVSWW